MFLSTARMAESSSKELLKLEANFAAGSSCLESKLFVCKKDGAFSATNAPRQKPTMPPLPKSQVLGKVQDFLGIMSESNKKLLQDAKENPDSYDIEVLNGDESKYIELDLMLGIADLHTPEAVAAAESALASYQPPLPLSESSSGSEDEDSSDDDDEVVPESVKSGSKDDERDNSRRNSKKQKPNKRPKIIELS